MTTTKRALGQSTSKVLGVRLPLEELALVERAAESAGEKPGIWAREVLLRAAAPGKPEWLGECPKCHQPIETAVIGPGPTICLDCWKTDYACAVGTGYASEFCAPAPGDDPPANYIQSLQDGIKALEAGAIAQPVVIDPRANLVATGWAEDVDIKPGDVITIASVNLVNPLRYHSWHDEWSAMEQMDPAAAMARLNELRAGRELPDGFRAWPKAEKIAWLDRNWSLK